LDQTYQRFLAVADKKQEVFDEDLAAIVHDEIHRSRRVPAGVHAYLQRHVGHPTATVRVRVKDEVREGAAIETVR